MKPRLILLTLLVFAILSSCAPVTTPTPAPTATEAATIVPTVTTAPTITPTPSLVSLPVTRQCIDSFVVALQNAGLDTSAEKIFKNGLKIQNMTAVDGSTFEIATTHIDPDPTRQSELLEGDYPLMIKMENEWVEVTPGILSEKAGLLFYYLNRGYTPENIRLVQNQNVQLEMNTAISVNQVFGNFTNEDWLKILSDWEHLQNSFNNQKNVTIGFPYDWSISDALIQNTMIDFNNKASIAASQLIEDGTSIESLLEFKVKNQASDEDMLKIFEFIVRSRVLQYPEIRSWHVTDEVAAAFVQENPENRFWTEATGLEPAQLALAAAELVKKDNPSAQTYVTEPNIFDTGNPVASAEIDYFYQEFLPEIVEGNSKHIIDGVIGENNWWIFEPPNWEIISTRIDKILSSGLTIGGSETLVITGDIPINNCCGRIKQIDVTNRNYTQADIFAQWLNLYLSKGVTRIGFGGLLDDKEAWTNDGGLTDANPLLLDDSLHPKFSLYAVEKILLDRLKTMSER